MKRGLSLAGLALMACAEPSMIETINAAVNSYHAYSYYTRKLSQARILEPRLL
jgi:hypothetical protein